MPHSLSRLMVEAQKLFDMHAGPLCPEQLTAPVLHKVGKGVAWQMLHKGGHSRLGGCTRRVTAQLCRSALELPRPRLAVWTLAGRICAKQGAWRKTLLDAVGRPIGPGSPGPSFCGTAPSRELTLKKHTAMRSCCFLLFDFALPVPLRP